MTNSKHTKKALWMSVLSIIICFAMLIGTTFAWFTDSVTSGNNKIVAGNLDVELDYATAFDSNGTPTNWATVKDAANLFNGALWEPGHAEVVYLRISNNGSLDLKYQFNMTFTETTGLTKDGKVIRLSEHLKYGFAAQGTKYANRTEAIQAVAESAAALTDYSKDGILAANAQPQYLALVVYMPETVGNEANHDGTHVPSINLALNLLATQLNSESDSFGPDYDKNAVYCDVLATPDTLQQILDDYAASLSMRRAVVADRYVVGLAAGNYGDVRITADNITLVAVEKAKMDFVDLRTFDGTVLQGITFNAGGAKATYQYTGSNSFKATGYVANITNDAANVFTGSAKGANDTVVKNCTFVGTPADASVYCPINFEDQRRVSGPSTNLTVEGCTFECNALNYIRPNYCEGTIVIKDNVFGNDTFGTKHHNVNISGNDANLFVIGNSFNNWADGEYALGTNRGSADAPFATVTIKNNNFTKALDATESIPVLSIKTLYTAQNSSITIADNTFNYGAATFSATPDESGKYYMTAKNSLVAVTDSTTLSTAINNANNGDIITIPDGAFSMSTLADKTGITIIGGENTVIGGDNATTGFGANFGKNTTIKNITFSGSSNGVRYSYAKGGTTTFEDCTFAGDSVYGFHIDGSNGATFIFNNCTFVGFNAFAKDLEKIIFNNCTFRSNGTYGHTNIWSVGEFNNCTWGDNTSVSQGYSTSEKKYYGTLIFNGVEESYHHEFIGSAKSLVAFADSVNNGGDSWNGQKVLLVADINLAGIDWEPIGQIGATTFLGNFDGQGHTISNLTVDSAAKTGGNYSSGLFGWIEIHGSKYTVIENLNVVGATITGNHNCGTIVGYATGSAQIKNCNVSEAVITCNVANSDANGDKAGVIAGNITAEPETKVTNCTASNSTVTAGRDAGQLVGAGNKENVTGTATNVTVTANGQGTGANINNSLVGRDL